MNAIRVLIVGMLFTVSPFVYAGKDRLSNDMNIGICTGYIQSLIMLYGTQQVGDGLSERSLELYKKYKPRVDGINQQMSCAPGTKITQGCLNKFSKSDQDIWNGFSAGVNLALKKPRVDALSFANNVLCGSRISGF